LFVLDRAKGGSTSLFSVIRTENNYVNISMTSTGVPLMETTNDATAAQAQRVAVRRNGGPELVSEALDRLEKHNLKLNLAQINNLVTP